MNRYIFFLFIVYDGLALPSVTVQSEQTSPAQTGVQEARIRLTNIGSKAGGNPIFDFGTARFGQVLSHTFTLRNDTQAAVTIDHVQSSCGCLSVLLPQGGKQAMPTLLPGASMHLQVRLDTARVAEVGAPTLSGSPIHKQVYVVGQPVHAAVVLELRGRITQGVAFDPPVLDFGTVHEATGASRLVQVSYDAALYVPGQTRLSAPDMAT